MSKKELNAVFFVITLVLLGFSENIHAQESCSPAKEEKVETTSGCKPSSCRGDQTKFGEAKVISNLRNQLVSLKDALENSKSTPILDWTYTSQSLVGDSDSESLNLIYEEVLAIQDAVHKSIGHEFDTLNEDLSNAQKVKAVEQQLNELQNLVRSGSK